jgi:hypothetical protein
MDDILLEFGYVYQKSFLHSRGVFLEYKCDLKRCFVFCEGKTVYVDVIVPFSDNVFYRVSINQALWFNGVKTVSLTVPVKGQLRLLASELKRCCMEILRGDLSCPDHRYCFKMSQAECNDYFAALTGQKMEG